MEKSLNLKKISRKEALFFKDVFSFPYRVSFFLREDEFVLSFKGDVRLSSDLISVLFDVGGQKVKLFINPMFLDITGGLLSNIDFYSLPDYVREAVLEATLESLIGSLEKMLNKPISISNIGHGYGFNEKEGGYRLGFCLIRKKDGVKIDGVLNMDEESSSWVLEKILSFDKGEPRDVDSVPIDLYLLLGSTEVSMEQVKNLEVDDILIMDEAFFGGDRKSVLVLASSDFGYVATLEDKKVIIEKEMEVCLVENEGVKKENEGKLSKLDEIPIKLSFELGTIRVSLSQLKNIQQGYVFEIDRGLEKSVYVKANGKLFALGELIEIDGRIGVRIVEFAEGKEEEIKEISG